MLSTKRYTFSPGTSFTGSSTNLEVVVIPEIGPFAEVASGDIFAPYQMRKRTTKSHPVSIDLPVTDLPGYVSTETGDPVINWSYTVIVRYLVGNRKVGLTVTKTLRPVSADPEVIDFDLARSV